MTVDPLIPPREEYLGPTTFKVRVAPLRRVLVVQKGDNAQLRQALRAAAAIWGGGRCPILPVNPDGSVDAGWIDLAETLDVSQTVDFTAPPGKPSAWSEPSSSFHLTPARPLEDASFWNLHPVAVARPQGEVAEIYLPADDDLASLAGAGAYGLPEEIDLFRRCGYSVIDGAEPSHIAEAQLAGRTAIAATLVGDTDSEIVGGALATVGLLWVVRNPNSFDDIVEFWNLRALRPSFRTPTPASVLVTEEVANSEGFRSAFTQAIRRSSTSDPAFIIASLDISGEDLTEIATNLPAVLHVGPRITENMSRNQSPREDSLLTFTVNTDPAQFWAAPRRNGSLRLEVAQLRRPFTQLSSESPQRWAPEYLMSGRVALTYSSDAIAGPSVDPVAKLYHRDATWSGTSLRIITNNRPDYPFILGLPEPAEVLQSALGAAGARYEQSDKGQQITGIASANPDLGFFRRRSTILTIKALTGTPSRDLVHELRAMREASAVSEKTVDRLIASSTLGRRPSRSATELRPLTRPFASSVVTTLEELVTRGAAEMGLVVACPLCSLTDFQPLQTVDRGAKCRGCGSRARFKTGGTGSTEIYYRLSSLMNTLSLNGGLAPLAAHALLAEERAFVEPGANLFKGDSQVGEVDVLGWRGSSLFAGEAKMSASGFEHADIESDLAKAAQIGADSFVAICLDDMPLSTQKKLGDAASAAGLQVRILDQGELTVDS